MPVQRGTPVPPSRQIANLLREAIADGTYPPDSQLPSRLQLAAEHGVSQDTAGKALRILKDEGLIFTVPGYGTFVSSSSGA
jgi:GntR family transcriptional regulator